MSRPTFPQNAILAAVALLVAGCEQSRAPDPPLNTSRISAKIVPASSTGPISAGGVDIPLNLPQPGIYGDVTDDKASGTRIGFEVEIHRGPAQTVDFTSCEGECIDVNHAEYRIEGNALRVAYPEARVDGFGQTLPPVMHNFRLARSGDDVEIQAAWVPGGSTILKRLNERFGLRLAEDYQRKALVAQK
ncbi:hypothetical protein [Sphingobium nicotianae]|nr:hypothetical protein [Sphingobium nicotianae]